MAAGHLWTDDELRASVEAYLFLLRLQAAGLTYSESELLAFLRSSALRDRNEVSLRYRLRNISAVLANGGYRTLEAYPPADHVGSLVQARIEAMLRTSPLLPQSDGRVADRGGTFGSALDQARQNAEEALKQLEAALARLKSSSPGIGHNRPPDALDANAADDDLQTLALAVEALRAEIASERPTGSAIVQKTTPLIDFGMKCAVWMGQRATKAVDMGLKVYVSAYALEAANVLPLLTHAIDMVGRLVTHLP